MLCDEYAASKCLADKLAIALSLPDEVDFRNVIGRCPSNRNCACPQFRCRAHVEIGNSVCTFRKRRAKVGTNLQKLNVGWYDLQKAAREFIALQTRPSHFPNCA